MSSAINPVSIQSTHNPFSQTTASIRKQSPLPVGVRLSAIAVATLAISLLSNLAEAKKTVTVLPAAPAPVIPKPPKTSKIRLTGPQIGYIAGGGAAALLLLGLVYYAIQKCCSKNRFNNRDIEMN